MIKNKSDLTNALAIAITNPLQRQNSAIKVRGIIQDVIDSSLNSIDNAFSIPAYQMVFGNSVGNGLTSSYNIFVSNSNSILNTRLTLEGGLDSAFGGYTIGSKESESVASIFRYSKDYPGSINVYEIDESQAAGFPIYVPSNIDYANMFEFANTNDGEADSVGSGNFIFRGASIYNINNEGYATKLDASGFRVGRATTIYQDNTKLFQAGILNTDGFIIYSGNTDLYDIFSTTSGGGAQTVVQPGTNIVTGGTSSAPTISTVANPLFTSLTATTLIKTNLITAGAVTSEQITVNDGFAGYNGYFSNTLTANVIISGSTNLYDIFPTPNLSSTTIAYGNALNQITGSTNFTLSDTTSYNLLKLRGSEFYVDGSLTILTSAPNTDLLLINNGNTSINLIDNRITLDAGNGSEVTISDSAFQVALNAIPAIRVDDTTGAIQFQNYEVKIDDFAGIGDRMVVAQSSGTLKTQAIPINTYVQPGLNTYTGGTANNPTVNISAATLSSAVIQDFTGFTTNAITVNAQNFNGANASIGTIGSNSISGNSFFSGTTNLNSLLGEANTMTNLGGGASIYKNKIGAALNLKTLSGANGVTITEGTNEIAFRGTNIYYDTVGETLTIDPAYTDYVVDSFSAASTYYMPLPQKDLSIVITLTQTGSTVDINDYASDIFAIDSQITYPSFTTFTLNAPCSYRFLCTGTKWITIKLL